MAKNNYFKERALVLIWVTAFSWLSLISTMQSQGQATPPPVKSMIGSAMETYFFPNNELQSPYWKNKFTSINGGSAVKLEYNTDLVRDSTADGRRLDEFSERRYTGAIGVSKILSGVVINAIADTQKCYGRWEPLFSYPSSRLKYDYNGNYKTYFTFTGRLPNVSSLPASRNLFKVRILFKVKKGMKYQDGYNISNKNSASNIENILPNFSAYLVTAQSDTAFLIDSFFVTKGDLEGDARKYQTLEKEIDMYKTKVGNVRGPFGIKNTAGSRLNPAQLYTVLNKSSIASQIEIEVFWLGEPIQASIRRLGYRDYAAHLLLSNSRDAVLFRTEMFKRLDTIVYSPGTKNIRPELIGLYRAEELTNAEGMGLEVMQRILRNRYWKAGDTIGLPAFIAHHIMLNNMYQNKYYDNLDNWLKENLPYLCVPSIREHNGGRSHTPR